MKATTGEETCCANMRGAHIQQQAIQVIVVHMEGAGGVNMRGAPSQQ